MNRREALLLMAAACAGEIFGARRLRADAARAATANPISEEQVALLDALGETILPATPDSGGAKAAKVGEFIRETVRDFYDEREQAVFVGGLARLQSASSRRFGGRSFGELTGPEGLELLLGFERAQPQAEHYRMLKQLSIWGYFTSEIGATKAMAHVAVPGRYDGNVTIAPGTKAWSE